MSQNGGKTHMMHIPPKHSWLELHRQYGHTSIHGLKQILTNGAVKGLRIDPNSNSNFQCQACVAVKMSRTPYPKYCTVMTIGAVTHNRSLGMEAIIMRYALQRAPDGCLIK